MATYTRQEPPARNGSPTATPIGFTFSSIPSRNSRLHLHKRLQSVHLQKSIVYAPVQEPNDNSIVGLLNEG